MIIPSKIRVIGLDFEIEENEKVANEGNTFGSVHSRKQRIFLEPNETQQRKEQTLVHEMLHAIFMQTGLSERLRDNKDVTEEQLVSTISAALYAVLVDNGLLK
jgi:Zn-dependent peptidase ImmA (M78 family)